MVKVMVHTVESSEPWVGEVHDLGELVGEVEAGRLFQLYRKDAPPVYINGNHVTAFGKVKES